MSRGTTVSLTIRKIDAMKPGEEIWDSIIKGLHVRAGTKPKNGGPIGKSFYLFYTTVGGKRRKPMLGKYGVLTLDQAQDKAREWLHIVSRGGDPMLDALMARQAGPAQDPWTLSDLKAKYAEMEDLSRAREKKAIEAGSFKKKSGVKERAFETMKGATIKRNSYLMKHVSANFPEDKLLDSFTSLDIASLHSKATKNGGDITANRTVSFFLTLMKKACFSWKMVSRDVIDEISWEPPMNPEYSSDRFLTSEEAARLGAVLEKWKTTPPLVRGRADKTSVKPGQRLLAMRWRQAIVRLVTLCLHTGARCGEIMNSRLSHINWQTGTLNVEFHKTNGTIGAKMIELSPTALTAVIERYEEWKAAGAKPECDWIIPGRSWNAPLKSPYKAWWAMLKEAKIEKFRLHDLRHSYATVAVSSGAATLDQVRQQLAHTSKAMTLKYAHIVPGAQKEAVHSISLKISDMLSGRSEVKKGAMPEDIRRRLEGIEVLEQFQPEASPH